MTKFFVSALAVVAFTGCSKKSDGGSSGDKTDKTDKTDKASAGDMPEQLATWMPADAAKAWQGAWQGHISISTKGELASPPAAIEIDTATNKAKIFDGKTETTLDFELSSPCAAGFKLATDKGTYTFTKHFAIVGGKLAAGDGPVGMRKGKAAIVCGSDLTTVDDKGTCLKWSHFMNKWDRKPSDCAWSQKDGKDVLTIGKGNFDTTLIADGDTLVTDQFRGESAKQFEKAADYAAAKAWVATAADKK